MEPFLLEPAGKNYPWGGSNLKKVYGKKSALAPLAETWECSTHPDGLSRIASGPYSGMTLKGFLQNFPEALGKDGSENGELPFLVKLVDAEQDLPIQVCPSDSHTQIHEGPLDKMKMWYVLHADPGATLAYGFAHDVTADIVRKAIEDDTLLVHLQTVPVHREDVFLIDPGVAHAIGGGVLIAEVQGRTNVAYPVYNYAKKCDDENLLRSVDRGKGLSVMKFSASSIVRQRQRIVQYVPGMAKELICRCHYFQVERLQIAKPVELPSREQAFCVLLVVGGEGKIVFGNQQLFVTEGDTVFVPSGSGELIIEGLLQILMIRA